MVPSAAVVFRPSIHTTGLFLKYYNILCCQKHKLAAIRIHLHMSPQQRHLIINDDICKIFALEIMSQSNSLNVACEWELVLIYKNEILLYLHI